MTELNRLTHKKLTSLFNTEEIFIKSINTPGTEHSTIPPVDEHYVFRPDVLNALLLYLADPINDCLYLSGPSGCGKTSLILQVAARLNWGVEQLTLSGHSESQDLIGHNTLQEGRLVFVYGPLVRAMQQGEILILNELDMMSPSDLSALNDVIEGRSLTITAHDGEVITPHPLFRVVATANTKGMGDRMGFYNGARMQNQAFLDRWRFVEVDYPEAKEEREVLRCKCQRLPAAIIDKLLQLALELRRVSTEQLQDEGQDPQEDLSRYQLSAPFSTRVLVRIGAMMLQCANVSAEKVVDMAFASRLPQIEREYVKRLCLDIFGYSKKRTRSALG
ncbi:MAG: MoxR family ATPase [Succinivibrio sp.]|nr:MoxR family ATPase [Succinivibrio sp.]